MTFQVLTQAGKGVASFTAKSQGVYNKIANMYPNHVIQPEPDFCKDVELIYFGD